MSKSMEMAVRAETFEIEESGPQLSWEDQRLVEELAAQEDVDVAALLNDPSFVRELEYLNENREHLLRKHGNHFSRNEEIESMFPEISQAFKVEKLLRRIQALKQRGAIRKIMNEW